MLTDNMAKAIVPFATKSFDKMQHLHDSKHPTIQMVFHDFWEKFLKLPHVINRGIREVVKKEVEKMINCGTLDSGFEVYECPHCHNTHIICYTCKSRFCPSCGMKYVKERAANITKMVLNVEHRHAVFTIDERLRIYFREDYSRLNLLFTSVNQTIDYVLNKTKMNSNNKSNFKKKKRKKKKSKNLVHPGMIMVLHTFGRDLKWNPHIHVLITDGVMKQNGFYKPDLYLDYKALRFAFRTILLNNMTTLFEKGTKEYKEFTQLKNTIYKEDTEGFYVYAPKMKNIKNKEGIISYIVRYAGRPVMAQSRITDYDYDKQQISYYYEDHETEERVDVTESVFDFIGKLIIHIPEPQFKMIRYYGIYATCNHKLTKAVTFFRNKTKKALNTIARNTLCYRRELITTFHVDALLCSCGHYMEFVDYWVPRKLKEV